MADHHAPIHKDANSEEAGIHMYYIRRDLDDLRTLQNKQHTEIMQKFLELTTLYPTKQEFSSIIKNIRDHEERIRTVEHSVWKWTGIASGVSVVATLIVNILLK